MGFNSGFKGLKKRRQNLRGMQNALGHERIQGFGKRELKV